MSAYIVDSKHIIYLVSAAISHRIVTSLRKACIPALPGYDEAAWGAPELMTEARLAANRAATRAIAAQPGTITVVLAPPPADRKQNARDFFQDL